MLVSILIPVYNVERFLPQCLDSIILQSYDNLQIVLIDDGSKDNSWSVMQKYAHLNKRIEIYRQENKGVAYTRNRLLEKIKGDFVLFVDSDDWIEPDMVEFLVTKAIQYKADVVTCGMVINDSIPSANYTELLLDRTETIRKFLFHKELKGSLCNKLVKTSLLHKLSFEDSIGYGEDALFCWQIFKKVERVVFATRQLYHYRMNETSISHSSFGPQKLTGSLVWDTICYETKQLYPFLLDIANARHLLENAYLLRDASLSKYPYNNEIKELQLFIKNNIKYVRKERMSDIKEIINSYIIAYWYSWSRFYLKLHNIKQLLKY